MPINDPSQCVSMPIFIYPPIQYSYKSPSCQIPSSQFHSPMHSPAHPPLIPVPSAHPHLTTSRLTLTHTRPLALTACKNAP